MQFHLTLHFQQEPCYLLYLPVLFQLLKHLLKVSGIYPAHQFHWLNQILHSPVKPIKISVTLFTFKYAILYIYTLSTNIYIYGIINYFLTCKLTTKQIFFFKSQQVRLNKTPMWCNKMQILLLQTFSTCFGCQAPIIRSIKYWHGSHRYR